MNKTRLDERLARAPTDNDRVDQRSNAVISIPLPNGGFSRFRIVQSSILAPELAAAFPGMKTYRGSGVDDPAASIRCDWTPEGFHAIVLTTAGSVVVDPYLRGDLLTYIAYNKADLYIDPAVRPKEVR